MPAVFKEKVRRPEPVGLCRQRLEGPLLSADGSRTALVVAPAGSGKTTLLARIAAASAMPTAWYLTGPEDGSESAFTMHLTHAINSVLPRPLKPTTTLLELITELEASTEHPLRVIIDDAHALIRTPAEPVLERFLRLRPHHIRLLIGSRRPLAINTPRLVVSGELSELDSESLRFRSWEVEDLFRLVYGEPLQPETAAALTRQTGGWAAGLKLFHLATLGKSNSERAHAVAQLSGRSRLFRSYLTWNVLEELDPDRREFLLFTSTLGRLTGPLCDALLDRTGSATILEELEHLQFFTSSSEDGHSYRYHQVLQTHLEGVLIDEIGSRAAGELHARSARLLEDSGNPRQAIRAYAMADDWASVGRLVQMHSVGMTIDATLTSDSSLPDDDPWLCLVRARRLLRSGSVAAAIDSYRHAESLLDDTDFRTRCADERGLAATWSREPVVVGVRSLAPAGSARRIAEEIRLSTHRLRQPADERTNAVPPHPLVGGIVHLLAGQLDSARNCLTTAALDASSSSFNGLSARLALTLIDIADGIPDGSLGRLEEIVLSAEVEEQPWLARVARGLQAALLLVAQPAPWRAVSCGTLVDECQRDGDEWGVLLLSLFGGVAHAGVGSAETARAWFARAAAQAWDLDAPVLAALASCLGVWTSVQSGDLGDSAEVERSEVMARAAGLTEIKALHELVVLRLGNPRSPLSVTTSKQDTTAPRPRLWVRCLGSFRLELDGAQLDLPPLRPRPRALLLLLAIRHGQDVHRELLIESLWPDAPLEAATHRLQVAASNVRQCLAAAGLGSDTVQRHGDAYCLQLSAAALDVAQFSEHRRLAIRAQADGDAPSALRHWSAALDLYAGDLLPEVGPSEWIIDERERLRVAAATAATATAELSLRLGHGADALRAAQRAIELDPLRDTSWVLLAEIQESLGEATGARLTRRAHAQILAELGVADSGVASVSRTSHPTRPVPGASRGLV